MPGYLEKRGIMMHRLIGEYTKYLGVTRDLLEHCDDIEVSDTVTVIWEIG